MASSILIVLVALVVYMVYSTVTGLRANIAAAKKSGLVYLVVPISPFHIFWKMTEKIWFPIIKCLPKSWWEDWLDIMMHDSAWHLNHNFYAKLGADAVLLVSPQSLTMLTASAEAISSITSRREAFPKDTRNYAILELFGRNVVTTEGALWRMHRKVTSASFNEKNTALVWEETIHQTECLIRYWMTGKAEKKAGVEEEEYPDSTDTITSLDHDTMRLALHIIGYVGFGLKLLWPGQTVSSTLDPEVAKFSSRQPPPGHSMSFIESLEITMAKLFLKLIVPRWLLRILPFKATRIAYEASENFTNYLSELLRYKQKVMESGERRVEGMDIMGQLVETNRDSSARTNVTNGDTGKTKKATAGGAQLTDAEIIGNAFIMIVAGHETTANTLHFVLLLLASQPTSQRLLQSDIDRLLGRDTNPKSWTYDANVGPLLGSSVGAAMNELMRLVPSVLEVPKAVSPDRDQPLVFGGKKYLLPKGTAIGLNVCAVQRNPKYWPRSSKDAGLDDLAQFRPERWLRRVTPTTGNSSVEDSGSESHNTSATEDFGGYQGPDSSPSLFRPVRGSYIPFSDGARSCLGRRIAQVEILAALSVILQRYSVELVVEKWASDEEVKKMDMGARREVYGKASKKARSTIDGAASLITLKLQGTHVPVRLVRRGTERFVGDL